LPKPRARQGKSEARRQEILQTALLCFSESGYLETTMTDICRRSKASVGSVYHHFNSKDELAAAVYLEGIARYQTGFIAELDSHPNARDGLTAMVRYHLRWIVEHPDWARFLFQKRQAQFMTTKEAEINEQNKAFFSKISDWFRPHVDNGLIRRLPRELYYFLLLGPSHDFARQWLAGQTRTGIADASNELADAAWRALKGDDTGV